MIDTTTYYRRLLAASGGQIQDSTEYFRQNSDMEWKLAYQRISGDYGPESNRQRQEGQANTIAEGEGQVYKTFTADPGKEKRWSVKNRPELRKAWKCAKLTGYPIEVADLTRLFGCKDPHRRPTFKMMRHFLKHYPDVIFLIRIPYEEVKAHRTRVGQAITGNKGGRPKKITMAEYARIRKAEFPIAYRLRQQGQTIAAIAKELKHSTRTIHKWLYV